MEPRQPPLERLPLHIVSNVLANLQTHEQLGIAVRSHRIFRDALKDDPAIPYTLVRNQIPASVLPFTIAVMESTQNNASDGPSDKAIYCILDHLEANILSTEVGINHNSLTILAFLTRTYEAVEVLTRAMYEEQLPLFVDKLGLDHRGTKITEQEAVRLGRALLRFQLMSNLFYPEKRFFTAFSPWVNEQLSCVYKYLERNVEQAFLEVAAHDVEWAGLEIEVGGFRGPMCGYTQWFSLLDSEREEFTLRWRDDIRLRGGTGFWPTEGFNFSRIRGLTEDDKRELMEQWRPEFEAWEEKHRPRSPATPPEPEPIPAGAILLRIPLPSCAWVTSDSGLNGRPF
ncbi:hypothetical protein CMUS01_15532 [Colletotrichum musicola]|uniref:Uncharacterized protein n=1 Tax=Colletotrichum musicola TaxID=2175873 RepID=A0A8H6IWD8_9PEZI|nr:hypothetical protein CMUS01_15532 [Colletotrichum musicola]